MELVINEILQEIKSKCDRETYKHLRSFIIEKTRDKKEYITQDDINIFNSVNRRFERLQENDSATAYRLMIDALQTYNRWSKIRNDIRKDLGRGQEPQLKDRLEEITKYLKEVHITSRMIWKAACDDLKNNREEL